MYLNNFAIMELETFLQVHHLSSEEIDLVKSLGEELHCPSGTELPGFDRPTEYFYFVKSGMIRSYRIIDGNDFTYNFFLPGEFGVDLESYLKKTPSTMFLQVITPTILIKFRFSQIFPLFEEHPRLQRIALTMAEFGYLKLLERMKEFQSDSLEIRYLNLIHKHEELFQKAPLQYIASYLGVKPQSLSRIRAKISKK